MRVGKRWRANTAHSSVAKKLSARALSKQSPRLPIDLSSPASRRRCPKARLADLTSLIRVMDGAWGWSPPPHRHVDGVHHQLAAEVVGHGPADHPPTVHVEHHGQGEEAGPRRHIGDVGNPQAVRGRGRERASHQIGRDGGVGVAPSDAWSFASVAPLQPGLAEEPGHPLAGTDYPGMVEFGPDPWRAGGAPTLRVDLPDPPAEPLVCTCPGGGRAAPPGIGPAPRDPEQAAKHGHRKVRLLRFDEREHRYRVTSLSLAKKAAAFLRISRSWRSVRTSRRR